MVKSWAKGNNPQLVNLGKHYIDASINANHTTPEGNT